MGAGTLDPTIHPLPRLSICSALAGAGWAEFATVRDVAAISDSALSKHARSLEAVGYLEIRKGSVGRRARTWLRLTEPGRNAFDGHLDALADMSPSGSAVAEPVHEPAEETALDG